MEGLSAELERLRAAHLYRTRRVLEGPQGPHPSIDGRRVLAFCSNDYLGLANHPGVIAALKRGADRYGVGSGAAHLVTGHSAAHHALEEELAEFVGRPRALLFATGYMANLGVVSALAGRGDQVFEDRLNHASLLDGALLSRARLHRYPHCDAEALGRLLAGEWDATSPGREPDRRSPLSQDPRPTLSQREREGKEGSRSIRERGAGGDEGVCLIASDGVFSMDGDLAPLPGLAQAARRAGARLVVDDAHGLGVLGTEGRGSLDHFGLALDQVPILVGTLGKAFGTFGAFVAGSTELIETLIQRARSYIYTTAPPPAVAEATRASLAIARREEWRRERLRDLVRRFRAGAAQLGLPLLDSHTPIQPLIAGSAGRALAWGRHLEGSGILVSAIRPPTVPEGSARLRIALSAAHEAGDVDRLLDALAGLPRADAA